MPTTDSRRARHPCSSVIVVCSVLAAVGPCVVGFQVAAPPRSCSSSSRERGASGLRAGRIHRARQPAPAGAPLCEESDRCLQRWGLALLSGREDGADGGGQEQQGSVSVTRRTRGEFNMTVAEENTAFCCLGCGVEFGIHHLMVNMCHPFAAVGGSPSKCFSILS